METNAELKVKKKEKAIRKRWEYYYPEYKETNNEELVIRIQQYDNQRDWDELDKRTQKLYKALMRDVVHPYYKENMYEDMMTVLKTGWVKAVQSYDMKKATADFIAYCSYLMEQRYVMFARRITEDKIGNSVRDETLSSVTIEGQNNTERTIQGCVDLIMKYETEDYKNIESNDYVNDMLNRLKAHDETQYIIIKKHCIERVTQKKLGEMLNMSQSAISRNIKKALIFLKKEMEFEEIMINV